MVLAGRYGSEPRGQGGRPRTADARSGRLARFALLLPPERKRAVIEAAHTEGRSIASIYDEAVAAWLEAHGYPAELAGDTSGPEGDGDPGDPD